MDLAKLNLTEKQEKQICDIILNSNNIHKELEKFLKKNGIRKTIDRKSVIKDLIWYIINKYKLTEYKCIPRYDNTTPYTQEEFDVIVGGLLGDTWIGKRKNGKNPEGSFTHKLEHYEYAKYKYELLKRRCSNFTIHNKTDKRSNRHYQQVFCKLAASSLLEPIYQAFYKNGIKIISEEYINKLSPLGIAIWYMDDGGICSNSFKFSVDCFTESDINLLQKMLLTKFNIKTTKEINQNKIIYVLNESKETFKKLVQPYICKCMEYKLIPYSEITGRR